MFNKMILPLILAIYLEPAYPLPVREGDANEYASTQPPNENSSILLNHAQTAAQGRMATGHLSTAIGSLANAM